MDATLRFVELVNGPSTDVDLTEGWLLLGAHSRAEFDMEKQRDRLADLAGQCQEPTLNGLRTLLFDDLGFAGDRAQYYDPQNSLIDAVLDRRLGLPISLSALMIDLGQRVGVPLKGIGMPGHFLVRHGTETGTFVDPFAGGELLDPAACEALFHRVVGDKAPFDPHYLQPVSAVAMLARMAANLVVCYRRLDDRFGMRWAARLRARCPGVSSEELVQLSQALSRAGAYDEAAALLEAALAGLAPDQREQWEREAARHRARLN